MLMLMSVNRLYLFRQLSKHDQSPRSRGVKADLHGAILKHATSLRHAYDTKKVVGFENMF